MCELLGLAFNQPVTTTVSFRGFRHRGEIHRDGWGLAWFDNRHAHVYKESCSAEESEAAKEFAHYERILSPIFIGHVRWSSCGRPSYENTHPFKAVFRNGYMVFAHNGTLYDLPELQRYRPKGQTDSERLFFLFLEWMEDDAIALDDYARIEAWLQNINEHGSMNLLFSDGHALYAYRDKNEYNGLCAVQRQSPFPHVLLTDEDWEVDLRRLKKPSERGFVIATHPLTEMETWHKLRPGALFVVRDGEAVFGA